MQEEKKPFVPADKVMPEFTITSVVLGILLAVIFGAANAYLGLRVGMTVSASIPAAVISMGIIRVILKRDSILENNMVQTIGSAGESVAAGAIFTLPALFMWQAEGIGTEPSLVEVGVVAFIGGMLGVLFMVPLRKALIVKEHGILPYPEGTACAQVLLAGESGGTKAGNVFAGFGVAAVYKFLTDGLKIFPSEVDFPFRKYKGAGIGADVLPALLGVGYICGLKVASYLFAGGILAWLVIMPVISLFGADATIYPGAAAISTLDTWGIWSSYIRYIGAGAVAAGGVISLIKSLPLICKTFRDAFRNMGTVKMEEDRLSREISMGWIVGLVIFLAISMWALPFVPVNFIGAVMIVVFGFFFATVSSRMVGLVGSSNNPVSGMAIATLLLATMILKASGMEKQSGMVAAIVVGTVICVIAAVAGDTSQDLKTGYLVGATPRKQQIGELIGVSVAALAIGGVLFLLNEAWSYGSTQLPAPQATLMKLVVEGVMGGNLPWNLVLCGVCIAIVVEILGIPVLPFAVGLYLPIHLSLPMMIGGIVRYARDKKVRFEKETEKETDKGILYCSGLIAGEGVVGIILAVLAVIPLEGGSLDEFIDLSAVFSLGKAGAVAAFLLLTCSLIITSFTEEKKTL